MGTLICLACGFILMGILFGFVSTILIVSYMSKQRKCTVRVEAVIADVIRRRHYTAKRYQSMWHPKYQYTVDDEVIESVSNIGGPRTRYKVGTHVILRIDPEKPDNFYAEDGHHETLIRTFIIIAATCVLFGVFAAVIGVIYA